MWVSNAVYNQKKLCFCICMFIDGNYTLKMHFGKVYDWQNCLKTKKECRHTNALTSKFSMIGIWHELADLSATADNCLTAMHCICTNCYGNGHYKVVFDISCIYICIILIKWKYLMSSRALLWTDNTFLYFELVFKVSLFYHLTGENGEGEGSVVNGGEEMDVMFLQSSPLLSHRVVSAPTSDVESTAPSHASSFSPYKPNNVSLSR